MSKSDSGKGDDRRPMVITEEEWAENWGHAFRKWYRCNIHPTESVDVGKPCPLCFEEAVRMGVK